MSHLQISRQQQRTVDCRKSLDKIVRFLASHRGPQSINTIRLQTRIDLKAAANTNVLQSLKQNKKVLFTGNTISYQPNIKDVNNKDDLKRYIEERPEGVQRNKLEDAFITAGSEISKWVESGRVVQFMNNDTKNHMLFWYPGRLRKHPIEMEKEKEQRLKAMGDGGQSAENEERKRALSGGGDAEEVHDGHCDERLFPLIGDSIIGTWNDVRIPNTKEELERQLSEVNLLSAAFSKKRKRQKVVTSTGNQRKKRKMNLKNLNLTNTHMLHDEETKTMLTAARVRREAGTEREIKVQK